MKVLVVGGGGREHAICTALKKSPKVTELYCAPGNGGIAEIATCKNIGATDVDAMVEYAKEYPWYAFEKNKGYGTAAHYEGLREHGTCPIHRMTFLQKGFEDGRITKG